MSRRNSGRGPVVLALCPNTRGMAWITFRGPGAPYDWGLNIPRTDKSRRSLATLERLIRRFEPEAVIFEDCNQPRATPSARIRNLHKALIALAADRGLTVAIYKKGEVQACFAPVGARTRQEIAEAVGRHYEILAPLVPPARKAWEAEHWRMPLFNAAALAIRYYRGGQQLPLIEW